MGKLIRLEERRQLGGAVAHRTLEDAVTMTLVNTTLGTHELMARHMLRIERQRLGVRLCALRAGLSSKERGL